MPIGPGGVYGKPWTVCRPIHCTPDSLNTVSVIMRQHLRYHESSRSGASSNDFATVLSSADKVRYCTLFLARLHCASTCPLSSDTTRNLIIHQCHIDLANLSRRKSYRSGNRSPRHSGNPTPNSFLLEGRRPKCNDGTIPITYLPRNCSLRNSGETTLSTQASSTDPQAADPPAQLSPD